MFKFDAKLLRNLGALKCFKYFSNILFLLGDTAV